MRQSKNNDITTKEFNMIYNHATEQSIIGAIMFLNGTGQTVEDVFDDVSVSDFYDQVHKRIFSSMHELYSGDVAPTFDDVANHRFNEDDFIYIAEVYKNTSSAVNLKHHVKVLKQNSHLRLVQERTNQINQIISESCEMSEKIDRIDSVFSVDIGFADANVGAKHITECMPAYIDQLEKRWTNPDEVIFSTGIPQLDEIYDGGLEIGLHAIAARPKMGKTELMIKMMTHTTVDRGMPVYVASLEMEDFQVIERAVSTIGKVDKSLIKSNFDPEKSGNDDPEVLRGSFTVACQYLNDTNLYIDDRHDMKVSMIKRECRKIYKRHGVLGAIYVDYLTLLQADGTHDRNDLAVASMTRALKGMSKEFKCPVILLLQLNRGCEERPDKRPIPKDSRDSGAIEQDVDSWLALYRDSVYDPESEWGNITEIIVRLNRHGGTGTAYQLLTGHGFENVDPEAIGRVEQSLSLKAEAKTKQFRKDTGFF